MPSFIHKTTQEVVEAVRLRRPLPTANKLPNKDIEKTAWAGDWFVCGDSEQGWLTDKEMSDTFRAAFVPEGIPLGAVVIYEGVPAGELSVMKIDPNKREIVTRF